MTEDYKIIAKDFIAKTLQSDSPGSYELFYGSFANSSNIYEDYDTNAVVKCFKQVVSPKNVGVMWTILALWSDTLLKGRFVILDENNNIVSTIDQYTSGVDIGCYYSIELDEKGRLYGIEWFNQERVRFIMLNNISIPRGNEYYADIRKTYDIPTINGYSPIQQTTATAKIVKCKDAAKYGFITIYGLRTNFYTFEINVESGNTWKGAQLGGVGYSRNPLIKYDSNNMFTCYTLNMSSLEDPYIVREQFTETQNDITTSHIQIFTTINSRAVPEADIIWNDENNVIIPFYNATYDSFRLEKIDLSSETTYTEVLDQVFYSHHMEVKIYETNGTLFMYALGVNESGDLDYGWEECIYHILDPQFNSTFSVYTKILNNEIGEAPYDSVEYFMVQNQYNLYNHSIAHKGRNEEQVYVLGVNTYQEIYNENNYNGTPYIPLSISPLKSQQFVLKNGDKILFARDVYNETAYGNNIDSSVQIPNNLLNDIEISNEQLWGTTKNIMNNENLVITKNKYEELILNIRNKLNIINNNDDQNVLLEEQSAILHQALTGITNTTYNNLCISYAKITYTDNTTENIVVSQNRTNEVTTITFTITPQKQVSKIEFISQNNTSYISFEPTLRIGKTYNISQDVRIGD